jgi:hypothetical protein
MQFLVGEALPMIAAAVQCDVDGISKGSHIVLQKGLMLRFSGWESQLMKRRKPFTKICFFGGAHQPSDARCVRWLFLALFDNGGKPRHCQSGVPLTLLLRLFPG